LRLLLFLWSGTAPGKIEIEFSVFLLWSFWLNDIWAKIEIVDIVSLDWLVVAAELLETSSEVELVLWLTWRRTLWLGLRGSHDILDSQFLLLSSSLLTEFNRSPNFLLLVNSPSSSLGLPVTPPLSVLVLVFPSFLFVGPICVGAIWPALVLSLLVAVAVVLLFIISLKVLVRHFYYHKLTNIKFDLLFS
jgi:hypothetical protein